MSYKSRAPAALVKEGLTSAVTEEISTAYGGVELPAELVTGHPLIDFEHRMLLGCISTLRQVCTDFSTREDCGGCAASSRLQCEGNLVSLLGDLLAFIIDHFQTEEQLMRDSLLVMVDRDLCEAHMEDHGAISGKVQQIVAALDPMRTSALIRDLDTLLNSWINHHVLLHDLWLARWLQREDSVLKTTSAVGR